MFLRCLFLLWAMTMAAFAQSGDKPGEEQPPPPADMEIPPAPPLSPDEALQTFRLPPGFRIELVAAEPLVEAPVAMTFGPDGRLWVLEMRGFMPNPDGIGEMEPVGRVVVLEDVDGNGRMDKSTVFLDGLVMPRALALVRDGLLVAEPPKLWFCRDTNGDGRADEKIAVADDYATQADPKLGQNANPEHASNGLLWALDNWIYSLYHNWRYRNVNGEWQREPTINRGQWGISQDDFGRLFYNSNSDQLRGDYVPSKYLTRNRNHGTAAGANVQIARDQSVWPIRVTPGINRGYQTGMLRDGKLARFTAACGPVIYRGDNFPAEFYGDAFVCEPSANLIRRNKLVESGGVITATNAYDQAEFLGSLDERFRPVNLYTGPDGTLYIVDMYRGILQHRIYLTTFLRRQIEERGLDQPLNMGRIYRVVHEGKRPGPRPNMEQASVAQLIRHLSHTNGWWRDTAQRLLIERADPSTVPALRTVFTANQNPLARLHALWTLDGLGNVDEVTLRAALMDTHPQVRMAGLRLLDRIANPSFKLQESVHRLVEDTHPEVHWQLALTLGNLKDDESEKTLAAIVRKHADNQYLREAALSGLGGRELEFVRRLAEDDEWRENAPGRPQFLSGLSRCVSQEKNSSRIHALLELAARLEGERSWQRLALLDGILSTVPAAPRGRPAPEIRPLALESEPPALAPLRALAHTDVQERVARLDALLTWPGKEGVAAKTTRSLTSEEQALFERGRELYAVTCGACHQPGGEGQDGLAPPLADSEWTIGSEERLIRIALHGMRGPVTVKGKVYELEMPGMNVLEDDELAAILTYTRRAWGHTADPVTPSAVARIRNKYEDREEAWTEAELLKLQ